MYLIFTEKSENELSDYRKRDREKENQKIAKSKI